MPIVTCSCGKRVRIPENSDGGRVACPECGKKLLVSAVRGDAGKEDAGAEGSRPKRGKKKRRPAASSGKSVWIWVGAGAAVVVLAVVVGILVSKGQGDANSDPLAAKKVESPSMIGSAKIDPPSPSPIVKAKETASEIPVKKETDPVPPIVPKKVDVLNEKDRLLQETFAVDLVQFGNAHFEGESTRAWTGAVVEIEARKADAKALFTAESVAARSSVGAPVPTAVFFTAGGRDGLEPIGKILARSQGKGSAVVIGKERYVPWQVGTLPKALDANFGDRDGTGRVHVPASTTSITVGDILLGMPVLLERGGGVEYGFQPGKKVRFGFLFPREAEPFTQIHLLGRLVDLDPKKRVDAPDIAKVPPKGDGDGGIYHYAFPHKIGTPSKKVRIRQVDEKNVETSVLAGGAIGFGQPNPGVMVFGALTPNSTEVHVVVNPKFGYTTAADLRFRHDAIIDLLPDGTVKVDRVGVAAEDQFGTAYVARETRIGGKSMIVMMRGSGPAPKGTPKLGLEPMASGGDDAAGWWAVKAVGGEPRALLPKGEHWVTTISKDLKRVAVIGPLGKGEVVPKKVPGASARVAVGAPGGELKTVWYGSKDELENPEGMEFSAAGQRLAIRGHRGLLVIDLKTRNAKQLGGIGSFIGPMMRAGVIGSWSPRFETARWVDKGDTELAVAASGLPTLIVLLDPFTGRHREVCAVPSDFPFVKKFDVADDLSAATLFDDFPTPGKDTSGLWLWRKGKEGFTRILIGRIESAVLSPRGKYAAVCQVDGMMREHKVFLVETATKKEIWSAPLDAACFAFEPNGKGLAIGTKGGRVLFTPLLEWAPAELVSANPLPIEEVRWSPDRQEIVYRRGGG